MTVATFALATGAPPPDAPRKAYTAHGSAVELMRARDPEVLIEGPWGTGKTRAVCEKLHLAAMRHPGARILIARQTRKALTQSVLVTFEAKVLHEDERRAMRVGDLRRSHRQEYIYPNGSVIVLGGLSDPDSVFSTEYDLAFVSEGTEATEDAVEKLAGRLRNNVMPYQQLIVDCNPAQPTHWLNQRALAGRMRRIISRHADNPTLIDPATGKRTPAGAAYLGRLDMLTGVRRLRYRDGVWAAAEGMVYEDWRGDVNVSDRALATIPDDWARVWAVDFGYSNPFVWQDWRVDDDGRMWLVREIYRTGRLVEDHARDIAELTAAEPPPTAIVCDHDAEDRATLERHLGLRTRPAHKAVSAGIEAVRSRVRAAGDGHPRLLMLRDSLTHDRDPALVRPPAGAPRPASTLEEVEAYIWDSARDRPVKDNDHGMDAARYAVAYVDRIDKTAVSTDRGEPERDRPADRTIIAQRGGLEW